MVLRCLAGSVSGDELEGVESLAGKILKYREAGNFFSKPNASLIIKELNATKIILFKLLQNKLNLKLL